MRVLIAGAGPAGLYAAILLRARCPGIDVHVVERNPPGATFGFGVVFSDRALDFLQDSDAETHRLLSPHLETWSNLTIVHRGQRIVIDGIGFAAIGRLRLLQLLGQRLEGLGVVAHYNTELCETAQLLGYDLVIAADGVNSTVRDLLQPAFGTTVSQGRSHFAWYGTTKPYDTLTQTFVETAHGHFNAHHYRYAPGMSTFIVECDAATFARAGLALMDEAASQALCEDVFAQTLDGHPLISNRSIWRTFPNVWNERWSSGNAVLVGDALRTAHFSIGSGTRLALEDVIALVAALELENYEVTAALHRFETGRHPIVEKLVKAANASAAWYEDFPAHMRMEPWDFAWSYIQRTGRVSPDRLRQIAPKFVAQCEAHTKRPA